MINKTKTKKKSNKANNLPKMYPRFVYLNLKHRKIESVTFAAPIAIIHVTKHPSVTGPVASIFSPGFRKKTSPGRQIFHQVAPFCQVAMLPFSITNDICWVCESRTGEAINWPGKSFSGSVTEAVTKKTTEIWGIFEKYFYSFTAQFLLQLIIINC